MSRHIFTVAALACALLLGGCINHKVKNPMAGIDSKQPDKGLYDSALAAMKKGRYQEARTLLQTLVNTYPESEYIARAKLTMGDSWYNEGGSAAWAQAEIEYKDFQVFYPNMPEAGEAQLKVATIHYRQMEKPDRDFAQATRAAEEYKSLIQQYPDSPLVPEAKQRLREVQEILADRQYRIANYYYLHENLAASQARLQTLVDAYPLYSGVDQALFDLGSLYEKEASAMRRQKLAESVKESIAGDYEKHAIEAYQRILTRYPAMHRAGDARRRLEALHADVPKPTAEALAESKAEQQSRHSLSRSQKLMSNFKKHPSVVRASGVGEPNMEEEKPYSAPALVQDMQKRVTAGVLSNQKLGLETVGSGTGAAPGPNQPPPGSSTAAQPAAAATDTNAGASGGVSSAPVNSGEGSTNSSSAGTSNTGVAPAAGATAKANGSQPDGAPPAAAPGQINEIPKTAPPDAPNSSTQTTESGSSQTSQQNSSDDKKDSSSKKKGKKGLRKLIPF
ncbi:MAG TPA: outer membrane protein assembly factor BamD [Candidatus Angelobacter sp.]|nr:outer membrane protein assembly factor BamD [Candidatus Angelobacter sp.]